ncbi:MAG: hypothetical protein AAGA77_02585 [Bacteroidota bacterium]
MKPLLYIIKYLFTIYFIAIASVLHCQKAKIVKGASEFRRIIFEEYLVHVQKVEKIRLKLDSVVSSEKDFYRFCNNLNFVAKNITGDESKARQSSINALKTSEIYNSLDENELATLLESLQLIYISRFGIWNNRYPHQIDPNSLRLNEVSHYGIEDGDRVLHFSAFQNRLVELLYLSYDSLEVAFNPAPVDKIEDPIFDLISNGDRSTNKLYYLFGEFSEVTDAPRFDKIVYDCLHHFFYRWFPDFKKKMKGIENLLAPNGELIIGTNFETMQFDRKIPDIQEIDRRVKRIMKCGFELKERIHAEGEYIVYRFKKINLPHAID